MSLKRRIRKLEDQLGSKEAHTLTFEEFRHVCDALGVKNSDPRFERPGGRPPPPANIDRLVKRYLRALAARESTAREADKADPELGHGRGQPSGREPKAPGGAES